MCQPAKPLLNPAKMSTFCHSVHIKCQIVSQLARQFGTHAYQILFLSHYVLCHRGTIISHFRANYNLLDKKITLVQAQIKFFRAKSCKFEKIVVILRRI